MTKFELRIEEFVNEELCEFELRTEVLKCGFELTTDVFKCEVELSF